MHHGLSATFAQLACWPKRAGVSSSSSAECPLSSKFNQEGMNGFFPTALGKQSTFSNILGPLVQS